MRRKVLQQRSREGFVMPQSDSPAQFYDWFKDPAAHPREIEEALLSTQKLTSFGTVLLDNSLVNHAFDFLSGEHDALLPTNTHAQLSAVCELVDSIVMHENVIVGPEGKHTWYYRPDLQSANDLLVPGHEFLTWSQIYAVLAVARRLAVQSLTDEPALPVGLAAFLGTATLDPVMIAQTLSEITPHASMYSDPNHPLDSPEMDQLARNEWLYEDFSVSLLGETMIAMNAVDPANAGRYFWKGYFAYTARRGLPSTIPESEQLPRGNCTTE